MSAIVFPAPSPAYAIAEINLGDKAKYSGSFDIVGSGFTPGRMARISQAPGPYTGKGTLADEAEMDHARVSGTVLSATTLRCYWRAAGPMMGNVKFHYSFSR